MSVVNVVCCQVEVSATGRSLIQRSPTKCGVSECDLETSTMRRPRPTRALEPWNKRNRFAIGLPCVLCRGQRYIKRMAVGGVNVVQPDRHLSFRIAL
jgi:hypothetical protein